MSGYYGYRSSSRYSSGSSKKSDLRRLFGDIVQDIERTFLNLPPPKLHALLHDYGLVYGYSAESYARKTYFDWKAGRTKLNGTTAERLLEILPQHLTVNERFELLKKLRSKHIQKHMEYVTVPPENWKHAVHEAINRVIAKSREFKLPEPLYKKATWLTYGDVTAAQRLLHAAEEDEARLRAAYLDAEFKRIEIFVAHIQDTKSISHRITIPQGEIIISITLPKRSFMENIFRNNGGRHMNEDTHDIIKKGPLDQAIARPPSNSSLLNIAAQDLSPDEQKALRTKVIDEKIALDISQHKADQRFYDSTRDMANAVHAVKALDQSSKSDYEVQSTFETASGRTNIHVKKNNNTVIIVVAVVIGIVIFILVK